MHLKEKLNLYGSQKEPFFFCISYDLSSWEVIPLSQIPQDIDFVLDKPQSNPPTMKPIEITPIPFEIYQHKFNKIQTQIKNGNTYLANLTTKTKLQTTQSLKELYHQVDAKFKLSFRDKFICFSPERFIRCIDNKIYTYPMKGTIDANIPDAKTKLLNNPKELAEHTMIVDLLRNDLSIVSSNVKVDKFRYCDTINLKDKPLIQTSSQISGTLSKNWHNHIGDILTSILPAGSISGTPKKQTIKILDDIEDYDREFFTGIFGVFDGVSLDSAVMIRFIQKDKNNNLIYKSGGGITCDSDVSYEYQEMLDKIYFK